MPSDLSATLLPYTKRRSGKNTISFKGTVHQGTKLASCANVLNINSKLNLHKKMRLLQQERNGASTSSRESLRQCNGCVGAFLTFLHNWLAAILNAKDLSQFPNLEIQHCNPAARSMINLAYLEDREQFEGLTPSCCAATLAGNDVNKDTEQLALEAEKKSNDIGKNPLPPGCIMVHLWNAKMRHTVRKKLPSNISSSAWLSVEAWPKYSTGPVGAFLPEGFPKLIWHATRKVSARL